MGLAEQFLAHAGAARDRVAAVPGPALEAALARLVDAGRSAWPELALEEGAFLRHVAEHLRANRDPLEALAAMNASDLYLACGCTLGDTPSLRAFDERLLAPLAAHARRWGTAPDDLIQAVRASLLVGANGAPPRIGSYGGQGPLVAWLRIVASRLAGRLRRAQKAQAPFDEQSPLGIRSSAPDPELAYLKTRYRAELEEAFRATLAALDTRERTLLRFQFLDGMNAEAIAGVYNVSKRTAERWLAQARERILEETRRLLAGKLRMEPSQLDTLLGLVQSEIDVSVREILKAPSSDPDPTAGP